MHMNIALASGRRGRKQYIQIIKNEIQQTTSNVLAINLLQHVLRSRIFAATCLKDCFIDTKLGSIFEHTMFSRCDHN